MVSDLYRKYIENVEGVVIVGWDVRETEKPNVSGWSLKRRVRIVDLPEPEGPDITIGRRVWVAGLLEGGIEGISRGGREVPVGAIEE